MGTPYLGEIKVIAWNYAPRGWAFCNGQLLPINQNQALFSLLGTLYGGNGQTNFALPNLQARAPLHFGAGITQGQIGGAEAVTLTTAQLPVHQHALMSSTDIANANLPGGALPAGKPRGGIDFYTAGGSAMTPLNPAAVSPVGGGQAHTNLQPYLVLNVVIALQGIFPSRN